MYGRRASKPRGPRKDGRSFEKWTFSSGGVSVVIDCRTDYDANNKLYFFVDDDERKIRERDPDIATLKRRVEELAIASLTIAYEYFMVVTAAMKDCFEEEDVVVMRGDKPIGYKPMLNAPKNEWEDDDDEQDPYAEINTTIRLKLEIECWRKGSFGDQVFWQRLQDRGAWRNLPAETKPKPFQSCR